MVWVVTRLCRDCVDQACVDVCPMQCIYEYKGSDNEKYPHQLYINPDECIDCSVCEPECPWEAIYEDIRVPEQLKEDIELNAKMVDDVDDFEPAEYLDKDPPTPEQVEENKKKWGVDA